MSEWSAGQELIHSSMGKGLFSQWCADNDMQAIYERAGWLAAPAAPVERTLSAGWKNDIEMAGKWDWKCDTCGNRPAPFRRAAEDHLSCCLPCAEKAGAFATPAPTVALAQAQQQIIIRARQAGKAEAMRREAEVVPAPKPAPRCEYRTAAHEGTPVERVMFYRWATRRMFACDACYLVSERDFEAASVKAPAPSPDNRPRATVGLSPVVFGLSVGILSRGMAR